MQNSNVTVTTSKKYELLDESNIHNLTYVGDNVFIKKFRATLTLITLVFISFLATTFSDHTKF